jgi:oligopeptidase B
MTPPIAKRVEFVTELHGIRRTDDYHWLREKENPEVTQYLEAENAYLKHSMAHLADLEETLYQEMRGRIQESDLEVPVQDGAYWYYSRTEEGKQYRVYARKLEHLAAPEEILLDLNAIQQAEQLDFLQLGVYSHSPDHRLLAYGLNTDGGEKFTIYIKRLSDNTVLETIENGYYSFAWASDNQHFFFTRVDAAMRPHQVYRRALGNNLETLVYEEFDEMFGVGVQRSKSGAYLQMICYAKITTEFRILPASEPLGKWQVFAPRVRAIEYRIAHLPGRGWLVSTNENAENGKLMLVPESNTLVQNAARENWTQWLAHDQNRLIEAVYPFDQHLVIWGREAGFTQLWVQSLEDQRLRRVPMPDAVYTIFPGSNLMMDANTFRCQYMSLAQPRQVLEIDLSTLERRVLKEDPVLGGFNKNQYVTERLEASSHDGAIIPISLVYKKGALERGATALYLYGYGAYGFSMDPFFSSSNLSLLDRGVIFAVAHVRGGQELGRKWYENGKWLKKKNSFLDFIACAEHLQSIGYTSPEKMVISGGSAGGLLVGATVTMRPDLCQVVVAKVPFVDALNTMLDSSLPLTVGEYDEWGNPNELEFYNYMASYAPFENTKPASYPHIYATAGLNDPRVSYHEPAKWLAKLRVQNTGDNSLVLRTNMGAGHGGSSGRFDHLREIANEFAFVLDKLGLA